MYMTYVAKCKSTDKRYVGYSGCTLKWKQTSHRYQAFVLNASFYFHRAIRKYGWDDFEWEVAGKYQTKTLACAAEIKLISDLKQQGHKLYNMTSGGDGAPNLTEESLYKIGTAWRGKHRSAETKQQISDKLTGTCYRDGYSPSEVTRIKLSKSLQHRKPARKTSSEYRGVYRSNYYTPPRWSANYQNTYIGTFETEIQAAQAWDNFAPATERNFPSESLVPIEKLLSKPTSYFGVYPAGFGKFRARIWILNGEISVPGFDTEREAAIFRDIQFLRYGARSKNKLNFPQNIPLYNKHLARGLVKS